MKHCIATMSVCIGWIFLAAILPGCSRVRSAERYVPDVESARAALAAALTAWQDDRPAGAITQVSPPVQVVDCQRQAGRRLERYQILGEVAGDSPRCFAVRLVFDNPPDEQTVRYVVVGIDPLWVFHEDDYHMLAHWECPVHEESKGDKSGPR